MRIVLAAFAALALSLPAHAQQVTLGGTFTAEDSCAANRKKDSDNPGNVHLEPGHSYALLARNATPGTHYLITVPGAPVSTSRWVPMGCGSVAGAGSVATCGGGGASDLPGGIENLLVASWEPAFCRTAAGRNKTECRNQTPDSPSATRFSLHGLWPDDLDDRAIFPCWCSRGEPRSCAEDLPDDRRVDISPSVMRTLASVMPGVQSGLEKHEWPKHGSCYEAGTGAAATPDAYFSDAAALIDQLNASEVGALFASHVGAVLTADEINAAFDRAFGDGASKRLLIGCDGRGAKAVIAELQINLAGGIAPDAKLADLILAAPTTASSTREKSCERGRVQRVAD